MRLYGLMAEFASADKLLEAARRAREAGYARVEAYSPFPVKGLAEAVGFRKTRVPLLVFLGGVAGGALAFGMQWYSAVMSYPLNIGGRPLNSWPSFIPPTFELTVLFAAFAGFFGMLVLNGLPRLVHPVFGVREFDLASRNRFFLCLRADDPAFERARAQALLESFAPMKVVEVPA